MLQNIILLCPGKRYRVKQIDNFKFFETLSWKVLSRQTSAYCWEPGRRCSPWKCWISLMRQAYFYNTQNLQGTHIFIQQRNVFYRKQSFYSTTCVLPLAPCLLCLWWGDGW